MTDQEKQKQLSDLVKNIQDAVNNAMKFADEHGLEFRLDTAYGMGGTYFGKTHEDRASIERNYCNDGWLSSSQNC
jgi:hypothetical protein